MAITADKPRIAEIPTGVKVDPVTQNILANNFLSIALEMGTILLTSAYSSIVREARRLIRTLQSEGKTVKVLTVGRKGRDQLRRDMSSLIVSSPSQPTSAAPADCGNIEVW